MALLGGVPFAVQCGGAAATAVVLNRQQLHPQGTPDNVITGGVLLAPSGWRAGMLLEHSRIHRMAPQHRIIRSQMSVLPKLRNSAQQTVGFPLPKSYYCSHLISKVSVPQCD